MTRDKAAYVFVRSRHVNNFRETDLAVSFHAVVCGQTQKIVPNLAEIVNFVKLCDFGLN